MALWSLLKKRATDRSAAAAESAAPASPYVSEYLAAIERTQRLGFEAPLRVLVAKDCVDMDAVRPVLLEYFGRIKPEALLGQTAAINFALVPLLCDKTAIPFNRTIGWMVRRGKAIYQHDEQIIHRFLERITEARLQGFGSMPCDLRG